MPREAKVRWEESKLCWRSDVGPVGPSGRRTPVRFKELPPTDKGRKEAEKRLKDYLAQRDEHEELQRQSEANPPVWTVVQAFLQHCQAKGLEERTLETYAERLATWQRYAPKPVVLHGKNCDPRPARAITDSDLRRVVRKLKTEDRSAWYIRGLVTAVKTCWKWAAAPDSERSMVRILPSDPLRDADVEAPSISGGGSDRYFPSEHAERLLVWIERWAAARPGITGEHQRLTALLFRVIYDSGGRPGELCKATWKDVDFEHRQIVLRKHKTSRKTGKARVLPLTDRCIEGLRWALEREGRHPDFIFTHRRGRGQGQSDTTTARAGVPWNVRALGYLWRKLRVAAVRDGLDVRIRDGLGHIPSKDAEVQLYDFRRSFTTDADIFGIDARAVADTQGHSTRMAEAAYRQRRAKAAVDVADEVARRRAGQGPTDPGD